MKIIFLDVDYVLNTAYTRERLNNLTFVEDKLVLRVKEICDKTNAKIVLSSTWRKGWHDIDNGKPTTQDALDFIALRDKFTELGIELYDKTPCISDTQRGLEIKQWFEEHRDLKIESFVILDDMSIVRPYGSRLIQTSVSDGLREKHVKKAIKMLGGVVNGEDKQD